MFDFLKWTHFHLFTVLEPFHIGCQNMLQQQVFKKEGFGLNIAGHVYNNIIKILYEKGMGY